MRAMVTSAVAAIEGSPLELRELADPQPGPGELCVAVRCCAICRTDLHVIEGDLPRVKNPVVPGHQVVGIIDRLGEGSRRFRIGDRVGIAWLRYTDGTCK